jgi:Arm DNA-binding domain/Phage integrase central domain
MKQNQLTQLKVKNAKPGHYADGMGLYLQVSETGTRSWVYRFMLHGRQREMGLGSVATFSLVEARERARQCRQLVHDGIDPIEQRRDKKEASGAVTLKEASEEYYRLHSQAWGSDRHRQQWKNSLKDHASMLFNHPVSAIDSAVIDEALAPIWTKIPTTTKRVKNRIEAVCKWIKDGRPLPTNQVKQVKISGGS